MNVAIFANTPAQVYFFKNIIQKLIKMDNRVYLLARNYGETIQVLNELGLNYFIYSNPSSSKFIKLLELPINVITAYNYLKNFHIDIIVGFGIFGAYTSRLIGVPSIVYNDTEPAVNSKSYKIQFKFFLPFTDVIITPTSFLQNLGEKHIKIDSLKEIAYLRPTYFRPSASILKTLGLSKGEKYVIIRFNAFDAVHDLGVKGFAYEDKQELVQRLQKYSRIFISSEGNLPADLEKYKLNIPKSRIHDVIYHATLLIADTGTMVTEGGILGTPAIMVHSQVYNFGVFKELEEKYNLIYRYTNSKEAIDMAVKLIQNESLKSDWQKKSKRVLNEKIDITEFMVWFIEKYPYSFHRLNSLKSEQTGLLISD